MVGKLLICVSWWCMSLVNVLILKNLISAADKIFVSNNEYKTSWKNKFSSRRTQVFWNLLIYQRFSENFPKNLEKFYTNCTLGNNNIPILDVLYMNGGLAWSKKLLGFSTFKNKIKSFPCIFLKFWHVKQIIFKNSKKTFNYQQIWKCTKMIVYAFQWNWMQTKAG